jgi:hypothetical protein
MKNIKLVTISRLPTDIAVTGPTWCPWCPENYDVRYECVLPDYRDVRDGLNPVMSIKRA